MEVGSSGRTGRTPVPRVKITAPDPPEGLVSRPRLLSILDSRPAPVTLVCAPAGAGKTLLLAGWARTREAGQVAWVSLDPDDNDDRRFWSAVLAALSPRAPAGSPLHTIEVPASPSTRPDFVARVAAAVEELPGPLWLVLDDLHELTAAEPVDGLRNLVRHQPAGLRLVLATRRDPELPLARLRLGEGLAELRAADLMFSAAEARELVESMGLELAGDELDELVARTEGWAAGLRLAALSLRATPDHRSFLDGLAASDRAVGEFLIGEVLSRMPGPAQEFVRAISICGEVNAELAGALTGRPDAGAMLAELERTASLAVQVGGPGEWYRLHSLLRTHVLADLTARDPQLVAALRTLAADWFAGQGEPMRALEHATAARDESQIVNLLRRNAVEAVLAGEHPVLRRALAVLPPDRITGDSLLGFVSAALHLEAGEPRAAAVDLSLAESTLPRRPGPELETLRQLVRGRMAQLTGDIEDILHAAEKLATRSPSLEAVVLFHRGAAAFAGGELRTAVARLRASLAAARAGGQDYLAVQCLSLLSGVLAASGEFTEMADLAAETVEENVKRGWDHGPEAAGAHGLLAFGALLRGDPQHCARHAERALQVLDEGPSTTARSARLFTGILLGTAEFDGGDPVVGARRMIAARAEFGGTRLLATQVALTAFLEHRAAIALGWTDLAGDALRWCEKWLPGCGELLLMRARGQLASGHHGAAAMTLRPLVAGSVPLVHPWSQVWVAVTEAETAVRADDYGHAHRALAKALKLAEPQRVRHPLVFLAPALADVLDAGLGRFGAVESYAREILGVRAKACLPAEPVVLTERERDVLRLLPTQRSFEEIAEDLTVSPNTIKTHARALYGKLGVTKRREAVDAARNRGLLEDLP